MWIGLAILAVVLGASVAHAEEPRVTRDGGTLCLQTWPRQVSATHTRIICGLEQPRPGFAWTMVPARECVQLSSTSPWRCWARPELEQYHQAAELRELLPLMLMRPAPAPSDPGLAVGQGVLDSLAGVPPRFPGAPPSYRCQWRGNAPGERYWQCDPW